MFNRIMSNPIISVIVPVYNAESTIRRCVDSILAQSFKHFECLLINDGSSDKSGEICDGYAARDNRIKVLHKENGGVSSARNAGLEKMTGKWVVFIDSDDWVKEVYLSNMLLGIERSKDIGLVISFSERVHNNVFEREIYPSRIVKQGEYDCLFTQYDMSWHTSPWSKLFNVSIINANRLRFCEGMHIGEDAVFFYSYLSTINKIYISGDTDYYYCMESMGSLTKRVFDIDSETYGCRCISDAVDNLLTKCEIKEAKAIDTLSWLKATYIRRVLTSLYYNPNSRRRRLEIIRQLDIDTYCKYISDTSFLGKIYAHLLALRFLKIYDALRICIVRLKGWVK